MSKPKKTKHSPLNKKPNKRKLFLILLSIPTFILLSLHLSTFLLYHANSFNRRCLPGGEAVTLPPSLKIAMVTFSDETRSDVRLPRGRSFKGLMELVGRNKKLYAEKMGYDFLDAERLVDRSRPPNWSKIVAVRFYLDFYDWVFWNDADTVVTNSDISLECILKAAIGHLDFDASQDLLVTEDINGVNSGVFFLRRSEWSKDFLDKWWNQTSFIQFGSTKSGDNAAMKHLIDGLTTRERQNHVKISSMQCLFNSYPWDPTWKSFYRLISLPRTIWKGTYSKGDFMVHLAGFDNKREWAARILRDIKS